MSKKILVLSAALLVVITSVFYFRYRVYYSHGDKSKQVSFEIKKGEGNAEIAANLEAAELISGKIYFYYYLRSHDLLSRIMPGDYNLSGSMTIPEIAAVITEKRDDSIRVTFPEGWSSRKMADKLNDLGLDGEGFLEIVEKPQEFSGQYGFLEEGKVSGLEGYLFPDTYFFKKNETAENIVSKMLNNFDEKLAGELQMEIERQGRSVREIVIMASIIEKEVMSASDMKLVGGIFYNRLAANMPLQSDATLSYYFQDDKDQHQGEELDADTPYNTYRYKGLPSGPIGNPGEKALVAAIYPEKTEFMYFLSDKNTKETVFSRTFEEHVDNKKSHGL
ncbi:MAG: Endolytic murein transglycosylase [Patescibacteria group bacterium]|nr:Endolytic murein transglycosylase [Patescibacteria group bacterium]